MLILGLPYATMVGALIAFAALIPVAAAIYRLLKEDVNRQQFSEPVKGEEIKQTAEIEQTGDKTK